MTVKVSDVMRHVRNHFVRDSRTGTWKHVSGTLTPSAYFSPGMWIAIVGAGDFCGVYQLDEQGGIPDLGDVSWTGEIYRLNPPADFIRLCGDISCWAAANPDPAIQSEKLGQYSVTREACSWETAFAAALNPDKRMFTEVKV